MRVPQQSRAICRAYRWLSSDATQAAWVEEMIDPHLEDIAQGAALWAQYLIKRELLTNPAPFYWAWATWKNKHVLEDVILSMNYGNRYIGSLGNISFRSFQ